MPQRRSRGFRKHLRAYKARLRREVLDPVERAKRLREFLAQHPVREHRV